MMKALAEQIGDLDGVEIYGRVVGVRGLMVEVAGPIHAMSVGARLTVETGAGRGLSPARWSASPQGHALAMPFAALDGVRRGCRAVVSTAAGCGAAVGRLARPRRQRAGRADRRARAAAAGAGALFLPLVAAAGACPPPRRRAARSRRARAQYLRHLLPRPAHGHLRRLRRRQIGAAVDAGAQRGRRRFGDRPGRRTRPRGAGVLAGRPRPGRSRPLGGRGLDLGRAGADAPPGGLSDARHRRVLPRPAQGRAGADGFGHPLRHGAARDRPVGRRAADRQGLYADGLHRTAAASGARRPRHRRGHHHRHLHGAGRRRRPQRAGRRRRARHPRRPHRHGARHRRARPLSGDQHPEIDLPDHAAGGRPRLRADHRPRPAGDGDLCRHGGVDPARRLSGRLQPRGRRGHRPAQAAGGLPGPGQGRGHLAGRRISALRGDPGGRWKPKTNVIAPQSTRVGPGRPRGTGLFGRAASEIRGFWGVSSR